MVKILAIDPSLSCSGYAIYDNSIFKESGIIPTKIKNTSCNMCNIERLYEIKDRIKDFILKYKGFDYLIIEGYSFTKHSQASSGLHELGGILKLLAYEYNIKIVIVAPNLARKYLNNNPEYKSGKDFGLTVKEVTHNLIEEKYNKDFDTSDEADAYLFCNIMNDYINYINKFQNDFDKAQNEVFITISQQLNEIHNCKKEHYNQINL